MKLFNKQIIPVFILIYVLLASVWWGWLLFRKSEELYQERLNLLIRDADDFSWPQEYFSVQLSELNAKQKRQRFMIYGESVVFVATLIAGGWFVYGSMRRELVLARQQSNFLLSVTHELKSPVAAIQLAAETLQKKEWPFEQVKSMGAATYQEAVRLEKLVSNILMAARLETSPGLKKSAVNLLEWAEGILESYRIRHPEFSFRHVFPDNNITWKADPMALQMALENLLENSVRYSEPGKDIVLKINAGQHKYITISVADEGQGIIAAERKNVLKKFYRIGAEEVRSHKGTGLGLYIVDQVATSHGGKVEISENHPRGTIVTIYLPKKQNLIKH